MLRTACGLDWRMVLLTFAALALSAVAPWLCCSRMRGRLVLCSHRLAPASTCVVCIRLQALAELEAYLAENLSAPAAAEPEAAAAAAAPAAPAAAAAAPTAPAVGGLVTLKRGAAEAKELLAAGQAAGAPVVGAGSGGALRGRQGRAATNFLAACGSFRAEQRLARWRFHAVQQSPAANRVFFCQPLCGG